MCIVYVCIVYIYIVNVYIAYVIIVYMCTVYACIVCARTVFACTVYACTVSACTVYLWQEVTVLSRLRHPNVAKLLGVSGSRCMVSELIRGKTLQEVRCGMGGGAGGGRSGFMICDEFCIGCKFASDREDLLLIVGES